MTDRQNSVLALLDDSGWAVARHGYRGFARFSPAGGLVEDRYQYTGREYDERTGLQYHRAPWFDPGSGRWTSEDPLGLAAGDSNLYRYAFNSPTNFTDPSGQIVFIPFLIVGAALITGGSVSMHVAAARYDAATQTLRAPISAERDTRFAALVESAQY